jgi:hypothetical protein
MPSKKRRESHGDEAYCANERKESDPGAGCPGCGVPDWRFSGRIDHLPAGAIRKKDVRQNGFPTNRWGRLAHTECPDQEKKRHGESEHDDRGTSSQEVLRSVLEPTMGRTQLPSR